MTPTAGSIATVYGGGDPKLLSNINGNDFDVAAGAYLVQLSGAFTADHVGGSFRAVIRDAADDSEIDTAAIFSGLIADTYATPLIWPGMLLLSEDTTVNVYFDRIHREIAYTGMTVTFAPLR